MIEVKNLVKKYGDHIAVDHLSFTVEEGHIYGFLGPNGAGKSTTMNMITGYIGPTEGSIMINGHDMLENPEEAKKCIGYLPEIPPLYTDMTPLEYLRFAAELKGIARNKKEEEVQKVIADAKLEAVSDRLIRNLSKGYKQRVGLAQALLGYPEVIILDEPTVGLDPAQIIEMRGLIRSLGKKHTVILSSHILSEISAVCDDVLILSHGKLVSRPYFDKSLQLYSTWLLNVMPVTVLINCVTDDDAQFSFSSPFSRTILPPSLSFLISSVWLPDLTLISVMLSEVMVGKLSISAS